MENPDKKDSIPDWMREEPLAPLSFELPEEEKIPCPVCGCRENDFIEGEDFHCLNCGSKVQKLKCKKCGHEFDF